METTPLADRVARLFSGPAGIEPQTVQPLPGLTLLRQPVPTAFESMIYEPVICLIVQGRKETTLGARTLGLGAGDCVLVSHDLPVVSRITEAPYLSIVLAADLEVLRSLYEEVADAGLEPGPSHALEVQRADPHVYDALSRYLALVGRPTDAKVLGPSIVRELHYRLLMAPFGGMLRSLIRHDSHESAIARAITHLRHDFRAPVAVPELARRVGMSTASFHKHFKAVTASTPLQFQKELRLQAARRLLRSGAHSVATAAYDVGYESASQFSREYARKFGAPPRQDLATT